MTPEELAKIEENGTDNGQQGTPAQEPTNGQKKWEDKKSWWQKLGTAAKIGVVTLSAVVVGAAAYGVSLLIGGKDDDDEPVAIGDGTDDTTTE